MQFFRHRQRAIDPDRVDPVAGPPDRRDAFAAGKREGKLEERHRHRGHPMIGLLVALVAVIGRPTGGWWNYGGILREVETVVLPPGETSITIQPQTADPVVLVPTAK